MASPPPPGYDPNKAQKIASGTYAPQTGGSQPGPMDPTYNFGTQLSPNADPTLGQNPDGSRYDKSAPLYRNGSGNLTNQSNANGTPLTQVMPDGSPFPTPGNQIIKTSTGQQTSYVPSNIGYIGGDPNNPYSPGGAQSFAGQTNAALQYQGAMAAGRAAPQISTGATNMIMSGAGQSLGQANGTDLLGLGNAGNLAGTATGAGYQGQLAAAQSLGRMALMPAGPSVAQQQLQQGGDQAMQQQMAMASAARGGNAGLALQNAGANQGQIMGNLNAQMGIQRAQEDMANRQFAANAAQAAGGMYGQAAGTQQAAYGGAGGLLGNVAGNQVQQANTQAGIGQTYAGLAGQQAQLGLGQQQLNDQTMLASQGMGLGLLTDQQKAWLAQQNADVGANLNAYGINSGVENNLFANRDRTGEGTITGSAGGDKILGAGATVLGSMGALSDIRAKTAIAPADESISDAFRPLSASSYFYRNPEAVGATSGRQYGPMAQELEKTPAGATAVTRMPDGKKGIDTGRLALLNASATAKLQREIDALKGQAAQIRGTTVQYPQSVAAFPDASQQVPDLSDAMAQAQRIRNAQVAYPQPRPYTLGGV